MLHDLIFLLANKLRLYVKGVFEKLSSQFNSVNIIKISQGSLIRLNKLPTNKLNLSSIKNISKLLLRVFINSVPPSNELRDIS